MILSMLNGWGLYVLCGLILLFVAGMCLLFLVRAWRTGLAIGLEKGKLKKAVTSSVLFTMIPSISILLGVAALSGTLGVPLPWLRLSVIGALHYETSVADIAARSIGLSGLSATEMTLNAFVTIALLMSAGIIWGMVCTLFFNKPYLKRLEKVHAKKEKEGRSFGDKAMTAMFIGLVACYAASYIGTYKTSGNMMPLLVMIAAAGAMWALTWLKEKMNWMWLENFALAGSMLVGMGAAVAAGLVM